MQNRLEQNFSRADCTTVESSGVESAKGEISPAESAGAELAGLVFAGPKCTTVKFISRHLCLKQNN